MKTESHDARRALRVAYAAIARAPNAARASNPPHPYASSTSDTIDPYGRARALARIPACIRREHARIWMQETHHA